MKLGYIVPPTEACSYRKRMKLDSAKSIADKSYVRIDTQQVKRWVQKLPPDHELIIAIEFTD